MAIEVVGRLRTDLILNAAQFEAGVNKAQTKIHGFAQTVKSAATSLRGFAAIGVGGFGIYSAVNAIKSQFAAMEEVGKQSKTLGIGTEALSALQYAAKMSETGIDDLSNALKFMGKNLSDAGVEGKAAQSALAAIRIDVSKLRALKPEQQFVAIADAISKIQSPADRLKVAMAIFGRGGAGILPLVGEGAGGIGKLVDEAKRLGVAFDEVDVAKIMKANDAIDKMKSAWQGLVTVLAVDASANVDRLASAAQKLAEWQGSATARIATRTDAQRKLTELWKSDREAYKRITAPYKTWSGALDVVAAAAAIPSPVTPAVTPAAKVNGPALNLASGAVMPLFEKLGKSAMATATSALNTAWRLGAGAGGAVVGGINAAGAGIHGGVAALDKLHQDAYERTKQMILSRQMPSTQLGGGAEKGSAAAYSAIVRAMIGDAAKKEQYRIMKEQLTALNKSAKSLGIIEKGLGKDQVLNLDAL